jgi:hypothetical protein
MTTRWALSHLRTPSGSPLERGRGKRVRRRALPTYSPSWELLVLPMFVLSFQPRQGRRKAWGASPRNTATSGRRAPTWGWRPRLYAFAPPGLREARFGEILPFPEIASDQPRQGRRRKAWAASPRNNATSGDGLPDLGLAPQAIRLCPGGANECSLGFQPQVGSRRSADLPEPQRGDIELLGLKPQAKVVRPVGAKWKTASGIASLGPCAASYVLVPYHPKSPNDSSRGGSRGVHKSDRKFRAVRGNSARTPVP